MHEVSIALGMVDELFRIAKENHAKKITLVRLKIGKMSGIVTDSLKFAFDAIKLEHPLLSGAEILIEEVPLVYECSDCHVSFSAEDIYFPACEACGSRNLKLVSGEEQHIESVEIEV
ncbi:MAG: hydrogenase maturation nickel metallochaperone HypA [Nitrospiraceae bacterium]|nr:MAG: hydrogenase maturation nickel metallochaperone HypA [Nitrospiraceae bacterium]